MNNNILLSFPTDASLRFHNLKIEEHDMFYVIKFLTDQDNYYVRLEKYIRKNVIYGNKYSYPDMDIPKEFLKLEDFENKKQIKFKLDYDNRFYQSLLSACVKYKIRRHEIESYSYVVQYVENEMDSMFGKENWIWEFILFFESNTHKNSFCAPFLLYELQFNNKEDYIEYEEVFDGSFEFEV